jgi:hypothetical protein
MRKRIAIADVFDQKRIVLKCLDKLVIPVEGATDRLDLVAQKLAAVDL